MDVSMELLMMMNTDKQLPNHLYHHKPRLNDADFDLPFRSNSSYIASESPPQLQNHYQFEPYQPSYTTFPQMSELEKQSSMAAMREMIFRIAAMQPVQIDPEAIKPPKRKNVKISKDPQSVAARHRRERISEKIRILQRLVPGGTKMDTASMLDEAIHYVKFLKKQVQSLEMGEAVGVGRRAVAGMEGQMMMGLGSMQQMMC